MSPQPLRPGSGQFPPDQIRVPIPPTRFQASETGILRQPPAVPTVESYRQTVVRIWPQGAEHPAVDLVPDPDADTTDIPAALFGDDTSEVFILSGVKAFRSLTTRTEDAETLHSLRWRLDFRGWDWCPTVATSPDRQWVESGALVRNCDLEEAQDQARFHGQKVILRWDVRGMAPVPTLPGVDVGDSTPVPVRLVPARTGCPLRRGADDGPCKMYGGPWTSASIAAAHVWGQHHAMLLDAFGCDVCRGEGGRNTRGATDLFTPSREGGWQWGAPRTRERVGDDA